MKKLLVTLVALLLVASSSFAGVSFLTANSVGVGKYAVLGMYATNHQGDIGNAGDPQDFDSTSVGVRGEYGIMKDMDLLVAYSFDNLTPNIRELDAVQTTGNTLGLGVKYSLGKAMDVDTAVVLGYESGNIGLKLDAGGSTSVASTVISLGYIVSKQINNFMPYGAVAYKMLSQDPGKSQGVKVDPTSGTGLAFNIGCMIGIAANQAIAIEYNTENQAFADTKVHAPAPNNKTDVTSVNVSGISLGYVYMF